MSAFPVDQATPQEPALGSESEAHDASPHASDVMPPRSGARADALRSDDLIASLVYLGSRALLMLVVATVSTVANERALTELGRWDGTWYARLAISGYPPHLVSGPSTLGFFPLLPLVMHAVLTLTPLRSAVVAGVIVSTIGGLIATLLIRRLASGWWGTDAGLRAAVLFTLFPGSIVFSMAYGEGLLIPLAAGCILALERRRWLLAGILAGTATAIQPDAVVLTLVCVVSSTRELRRSGWSAGRQSVIAPFLSLVGIAAFAAYLWLRFGTPLATLHAQQSGWSEKANPLALVHQIQDIAHEVAVAGSPGFHVNLSPIAALIGAVILFSGLRLLLIRPRTVSAEAITWVLGLTVIACISENVAPNPRVLITAFPAVLVFAARFRGRSFGILLAVSTVTLILTSALTFGGASLTP